MKEALLGNKDIDSWHEIYSNENESIKNLLEVTRPRE